MSQTLTEGLSDLGGARQKTAAALYRVFDADKPLAASARYCLDGIDEVRLGRADATAEKRQSQPGKTSLQLGYADRWMSSQHAKLTRVIRTWVLEDTQSKNGMRVNGVPTQRAELKDGDSFELGHSFFVFRAQQPVLAPAASHDSASTFGLLSLSPDLQAQFDELAKIARSRVSVALHGPTGSGKEVAARAIHASSGRRGPFVAVNCGAIPADLIESELFGHRKGAFSGAHEDRLGLIRSADGGTLLLDEVGDLPLLSQPALLRVLQEQVVMPVGGKAPIAVDVRVISATHRNLERLAQENLFRDDLRARLSGYRVELPALSQRREDLGLLVPTLLRRLAADRAENLQLSLPAARALLAYGWPLNVRELEKALERALAVMGGTTLELNHFPAEVGQPPGPKESASKPLDEERRAELEALLRQHGGNISAVARAMGKARMQIQRWLDRYQLDPRHFRP